MAVDDLPTEEDINPHQSDMEEQGAVEAFLGKTISEAEELFAETFLETQESLMWMGPKAYEYYVRAAINYIKSEKAKGDDEILFTFPSVVEFQATPESVSGELIDVFDYVLANWEVFNVSGWLKGRREEREKEKWRKVRAQLVERAR